MSANATTGPEFGRLRKLFWPIHAVEIKKFLPMFFIYSLIVFNYSLLRAAKDSLLITAPQSGAMVIPFIKVWAILPMAFLSTLIFTRLSNKYNREKVFYIMMSTFIAFFFVFGFILYPLQDYLHPHALADKLQKFLPMGMQGLVAIFRNWTFALFYIMSELWGTIIMSVLFWGFANEVTSVTEAKRFYSILGVGANLATICAGCIGIFLSSEFLHTTVFASSDRWGQSLMCITGAIVLTGLLILFVYRKLTHTVFQKEIVESEPMGHKEANPIKMGMRKNFAYLAKSKYLICIAVIVLTYNLSLNIVEVVWKDQVHHLCPYAADYNIYMDKVLIYIGITSTIFSFFICGQVIRRFGWATGAYLTPVILFVTGMLFFITLLWKDHPFINSVSFFFSCTPLALCAFLGTIQNVLSRASKFTFFDVTKEIAFIPLSAESKLKGKAAIDGVGSRLGKSGGSVFHQSLLMFFGTIAMSTPFVAVILAIIFAAWIWAVRSLGFKFAELSEEGTTPTKAPKEAPQGA
ncbi:MAG: NTP/NDP exchange transporter [Chlamydiae bacterium]|nr:NTP/NDP exchange transporter [Chlamydiota bacterium]